MDKKDIDSHLLDDIIGGQRGSVSRYSPLNTLGLNGGLIPGLGVLPTLGLLGSPVTAQLEAQKRDERNAMLCACAIAFAGK